MSIASEITRLQTAKADLKTAIEGKGVTVPSATLLDDYADLVDAIQSGGGEAAINALVSGELSGDLTYTATRIGRCFANTTGSFTLSIPNATSIRVNYGMEQSSMTAIHAPLITTIPTYCFSTSQSLATVDLPSVTLVNNYGFYKCTALRSICLPKAQIKDLVFDACSNLRTAVIGTTSTSYRQFRNCTSLKTIDMCNQGKLNDLAANSSGLDTLILRDGTALTTVANITNTFSGTPFASGGTGGTIYIPKVLYDHLGDGSSLDYKAATNWSVYDGYGTITWAQIEGSQYENYYADGTPIPTT